MAHAVVEKILFRLIALLPTQRSGLGDRPSVRLSPPVSPCFFSSSWSEHGHACHLLSFCEATASKCNAHYFNAPVQPLSGTDSLPGTASAHLETVGSGKFGERCWLSCPKVAIEKSYLDLSGTRLKHFIALSLTHDPTVLVTVHVRVYLPPPPIPPLLPGLSKSMRATWSVPGREQPGHVSRTL